MTFREHPQRTILEICDRLESLFFLEKLLRNSGFLGNSFYLCQNQEKGKLESLLPSFDRWSRIEVWSISGHDGILVDRAAENVQESRDDHEDFPVSGDTRY